MAAFLGDASQIVDNKGKIVGFFDGYFDALRLIPITNAERKIRTRRGAKELSDVDAREHPPPDIGAA